VVLGLEGCPPEIGGKRGELKTFDVFATLTTSGNSGTEGASGWQIGLAAGGGQIRSVALDGVVVQTIYDDDGRPETPPLDPFSFDLANAALKEVGEAARPSDGEKGAVSRVTLGQEKKTVLQREGTARLARFTVEVSVPAAPADLTLRFLDGLEGKTGGAVENLATFEGAAVRPQLGSCTVHLLQGEALPGLIPGDCNHDATLDISDGVCLLDYLFLNGDTHLPCGGGTADDPSNLLLMDSNDDKMVDLSDAVSLFLFLFLGGPPHVLGRDCRDIAGCQGACP
jgi:hypothetical protein